MKSITQFNQEKDTKSLISSFAKLIGLGDLSKKAHNISLYDFFEAFDEENLPKVKLRKQIYTAFNNRNINQLKRIKKSLNKRDTIEILKINLMLAALNRQVYEITEEIQKEIMSKCLKVDLRK